MPIVVVVTSEEDYEKWLAGDLQWDEIEQTLIAVTTNTDQTDKLAALSPRKQ
jgi:heme/copper-type cytochrome/quinol oxidase subunit 2